jgi:hypothetical protein
VANTTEAAIADGVAPRHVTPGWLTAALRGAGVLPRGEVVAIEEAANNAFNSAVSHLTLTYSPDASETAPRRLVLKRNIDADWAVAAAEREVAFYRLLAPDAATLPMVVPCYHAAYDEQCRQSDLLLLDVSPTHAPPVTRDDLLAGRGVPPAAQLEAVVDALADFHAYWWEHPMLGQGVFEVDPWYRDGEHFARFVEKRRADWTIFTATEGADLPGDVRALYERAFAGLPGLWDGHFAERMRTRRRLTFSTSDCYLCQFLCPHDGAGQTYLLDFQGICADFPAVDPVFFFASFWTPEQRHEGDRETRMLRRYLERLRARGVASYTWDDLTADYRLMLAILIFYPIWDAVDYWWPKMRCLTAAYTDWRSEDLFASAR